MPSEAKGSESVRPLPRVEKQDIGKSNQRQSDFYASVGGRDDLDRPDKEGM